ncbi:hypothetical protein [Hyphomicrobium sp.]|uniref:hypothetical protein n=1 Tax=Hyphomicrobium sp. TaxID=82 RepID=UPI001D5F9E07|nr:hypothetical protein [Hyphomicrobium sp.]MBY0559930.1 hypothetical protein [Hyphomicrobium sp.]
MSAIAQICDERARQKTVEGWTPEHDDTHADGEMLDAAMCYFLRGTDREPSLRADGCPICWPWDPMWWKPKNKRRDLVRAGALMQAEIERLQRKGLHVGHVEHKLNLVVSALDHLDDEVAA